MGRSYFSLSPSALIILHPAPIITGTGFAGWPGQENTLHALQACQSPHVHASLLAAWWVSMCFNRATRGAANVDTTPQRGEQTVPAAPSHHTFLSLQSAPHLRNSDFGTDGPSACWKSFTQSVYFWTYAVFMLPGVLLPLITLGVIFSSLVPGALIDTCGNRPPRGCKMSLFLWCNSFTAAIKNGTCCP